MSERILVTGATGFVGRALVCRLQEAGHAVIGIGSRDADLRQRGSLASHAGSGVTCVVHLAGRSFVPDSWADPGGFVDTNVGGTSNVLEFCRQSGARLVYVSAYIYGVPERLPVDEAAIVRPNNPYAQSKHLAEQLCSFYAKQFSVAVTVLRPFNIYGPGQDARFLIPTIVRQAFEEAEIRVRDLAPKRDFVYVDDVAVAIEKTLARDAGFAIFNVASGTSVSVGDIIDTVQSLLGTRKPVTVEGGPRHNEIADVVGDTSLASAELGWRPAVALSDGIARILGRRAQP